MELPPNASPSPYLTTEDAARADEVSTLFLRLMGQADDGHVFAGLTLAILCARVAHSRPPMTHADLYPGTSIEAYKYGVDATTALWRRLGQPDLLDAVAGIAGLIVASAGDSHHLPGLNGTTR